MTLTFIADNYLRINYQIAKASGLFAKLNEWEVFDQERYWRAQIHNPRAPKAPYTYKVYKIDGEDILIQRGLIGRLRTLPQELMITDKRICVPFVRELPLPDVRAYQATATDWAIENEQGIIWAETGSGKTRIVSSIVQRIKQRTLVIVPTLDIQDQFLEELRHSLEIAPGAMGGGENFEGEEATVAQAQHFRNWTQEQWGAFVTGYGCVVIDEAHLAHRKLAEHFPAKYRFGLTATPDIVMGSSEVLQWSFGKKLHVASHHELVEGGFRVQPQFDWLHTEFVADNPADYQSILECLVKDETRCKLIATNVRNRWLNGHSCLVLCGQKAYGKALVDTMAGLGAPAVLLTSDTAREARKTLLDRARKGEIKIIVATSLADVGLDVPLLDTLYLAFPGRSSNLTHQRIGRVLRRAPDKSEPMVVDVVDDFVPTLFSQALHREATFKAYGNLPKKLTREKKKQRHPVF